jgi:hypothetical protein
MSETVEYPYPGGMSRSLRNQMWFLHPAAVYEELWPNEDELSLINEYVEWVAASHDVRGAVSLPSAELRELWVRWCRDRLARR